jgi:hypothetical protein
VIEGEVELKDKADNKIEMVKTGEALAVDLRGFGAKTNFEINPEENSKDNNENQSATGNETKQSKIKYLWWLVGLGVIIVGVVVGMMMRKRKNQSS